MKALLSSAGRLVRQFPRTHLLLSMVLLGGVILLVMFVKTAYDSMDPEYGSGSSIGGLGLVFILGMGVILLGVVLMLVMAKLRPEFFKGQVLTRGN